MKCLAHQLKERTARYSNLLYIQYIYISFTFRRLQQPINLWQNKRLSFLSHIYTFFALLHDWLHIHAVESNGRFSEDASPPGVWKRKCIILKSKFMIPVFWRAYIIYNNTNILYLLTDLQLFPWRPSQKWSSSRFLEDTGSHRWCLQRHKQIDVCNRKKLLRKQSNGTKKRLYTSFFVGLLFRFYKCVSHLPWLTTSHI